MDDTSGLAQGQKQTKSLCPMNNDNFFAFLTVICHRKVRKMNEKMVNNSYILAESAQERAQNAASRISGG